MKKCILILLVLMPVVSFSQTDSVTVDTINNYQEWGWEVVVIKNNYITLAIVPEIGGRVLQYSLGIDTSMAVNESLFGETYPPEGPGSPYNTTWGFGGYKVWPAPQSRWSWQPPPTLAWGEYSYTIEAATNDSAVIFMESDTEAYQAPNLKFQRRITVYKNTTHVKVDQIIINEGDADDSWGVWDVTQEIVKHGNLNDYENIGVYFPIESVDETWTSGGSGPSESFKGEIVPGIYHVQYEPDEGKIFARVTDGWISWVDKRDKQTYIKSFELFDGETYPDNNAHVAVYTNGGIPYMEVEVMSPVKNLSANGGLYSFTEDWYAARVYGPTLQSNNVAAIAEAIDFNNETEVLTGTFGSFYNGSLHISYFDDSDGYLGEEDSIAINPMEQVELDESLTVPENTAYIRLDIYDEKDNLLGTLSELDLNPVVIDGENELQAIEVTLNLQKTLVRQSENVTLNITSNEPVKGSVALYDVNGKVVTREEQLFISGRKQLFIPANHLDKGIYIIQFQTGNNVETRKIIVY